METIHHTAVIFKDRQREKFPEEAARDLAASILGRGNIHPPALRQDVEGGPQILAAGHRRFIAMELIIKSGRQVRCGDFTCPEGHIPYTPLGVMSEEEAFEVELDENIKRLDLTWQERARAEAQLLEFRTKQNAKVGLPAPSIKAIATEVLRRETPSAPPAVGSQITSVSTRIRLADHLNDPEVAKAKTEAEALKVVRKKQEATRIQGLATAFDAEIGRDNPHTLFVGDVRLHSSAIASDSVDCLLTDPPYGIDADTFGEQSGTGHNYEDSQEYFEELIAHTAEEGFRVCKSQAHAYVFCDPRRFNDIQTHFELAGWRVWPIPLIWAKGNGMLPRPDHAPRRVYEAILFASKGDKPVRVVKGDVIAIGAVRDLAHGAQKPVELYADLLSRSVIPGDTVVDFFAGSGTIFPAANRAKVRAIGIELGEHNANICRTRMAGEEDTIPGLEELEI